MSNGPMRSLKGKKLCSSKINQFVNVKLHCFHRNPLCNIKILGAYLQNIHISTATHPRTVKLVSN